MHVIYMSVPAGFHSPIRTDSHGHRPQGGVTCPDKRLRFFAGSIWQDGHICLPCGPLRELPAGGECSSKSLRAQIAAIIGQQLSIASPAPKWCSTVFTIARPVSWVSVLNRGAADPAPFARPVLSPPAALTVPWS